MADSNLFKPATSSSSLGKKKMDDGQFANPPAYPDVSGFNGPSKIRDEDRSAGSVQKSPGAKKGRV
jgi:hypothetical protein